MDLYQPLLRFENIKVVFPERSSRGVVVYQTQLINKVQEKWSLTLIFTYKYVISPKINIGFFNMKFPIFESSIMVPILNEMMEITVFWYCFVDR